MLSGDGYFLRGFMVARVAGSDELGEDVVAITLHGGPVHLAEALHCAMGKTRQSKYCLGKYKLAAIILWTIYLFTIQS